MRANWEEQVRQVEGRPDAEEQSVTLITIHAAKGLEWPIVIPINMTGNPKPELGLMHDRRSNEFSTPVFDVQPRGYDAIKSWNEMEFSRERVRLWYVAATRARDLLVLPRHTVKLSEKSWARVIDFDFAAVPAINPADLCEEIPARDATIENTQTLAVFADEAKRIAESETKIIWYRPSLHETDTPLAEPVSVFFDLNSVQSADLGVEVAGSATRGIILHKLMEEVLTGETEDSTIKLENRARELLHQLGQEPSPDSKLGMAPQELAATVFRTLNLPQITALRPRLVPEHTVFGSRRDGDAETLVSGIADAVACDVNDKIETIVDWKSDVKMTTEKLTAYRTQLSEYRTQTGAGRALLVLMTSGQIINA
jgi:exodeoxyribonuclease-5